MCIRDSNNTVDKIDIDVWGGENDFGDPDKTILPGNDILMDNRTLFFIPQPLSGSTMAVTYAKDGGESKPYNLPLSGRWEMGKTYTYVLTSSPDINYEYYFDVRTKKGETELNLDTHMDKDTVIVKSYRYPEGQEGNPAAWQPVNVTVSGDVPAAPDDKKGVYSAGIESQVKNERLHVFNVHYSAKAEKETNLEDDILLENRKLGHVGTGHGNGQQAYDVSSGKLRTVRNQLSSDKDILISIGNSFPAMEMRTANCYTIDRPGYYALPLVYGSSYNRGSRSACYWGFKDAHGGDIYDAKIKADRLSTTTTYTAKVLWQDVDGLVEVEPTIGGAMLWLRFKVGMNSNKQNVFKQGNAVIGVWDDAHGYYLWSWHIWVTPYKPGTITDDYDNFLSDKSIECPAENGTERKVIMAMPIGYVTGKTAYWEKKDLSVTYTQEGTNQTKTIKVTRLYRRLVREYGHTPLFQWGRKDPFPGGQWNSTAHDDNFTTTKANYGVSAGYKTVWAENSNYNIAYTTRNPNLYIAVRGDYWSPHIDGILWDKRDVRSDFGKVIKTMYDPSPAGFAVPTARTFSYSRTNAYVPLEVDGWNGATGANFVGPDDSRYDPKKEPFRFKGWNANLTNQQEYQQNFGVYFYTEREGYNPRRTYFLPTTGFRFRRDFEKANSPGTGPRNIAKMGNYWTAGYTNKPMVFQYQNYWDNGKQRDWTGIQNHVEFPAADCCAVISVKE